MSHTNQYSISPIAAAVSAALVPPAAALAQEAGERDSLEEIIVYATKRAENVQGIPSSVQALPEEMLKEMGAMNTEDYARFIPSVSYLNFSTAGSNRIIFRGVSTGVSNFIATSSASVYLDDTVTTATNGSAPDIRMLDVARVEALAGPQGTLFGASAQAGTLRIHTNQPDPTRFEASADAMIRSGEESDTSHSLTGVLNIPLVEDVFAIRIAAQTAEDGGFIDNVLGHTPDTWFGYAAGPNYGSYLGRERMEWGTLDNAAVVEEDWNSVDFTLARISARWNINDNWSATLSYNYSETEAQAGNDYNPFVGDLQTIAFAKNFRNDEWDMTSLTIEADFGFAQFVSATSYFDRTYDYSIDGTVYYKYYHAWGCETKQDTAYYYWVWVHPNNGLGVYYPQYCIMGPSASGDPTLQTDYIGILQGPSWQDRFAQEFRLSHQGQSFDWLAGLYYEDSSDNWDSIWMKPISNGYQDTFSRVYFEDIYGMSFPDADSAFLSTDRTDWEQTAVFGEFTWHINDEWHATLGGRWFEIDNDKLYLTYHAANSRTNVGGHLQPRSDVGSGGDVVAVGSISEFVPKFSLSWNVSDDKMLYGLYTEGYRTGGVNRSNGRADWTRTVFPQVWEPDKLANYEIGAKTRWADNTVQLNVSFFYMDWEDFQIEMVDPSGDECVDPTLPPGSCGAAGELPWLKVVGNAGDAHSSGVQAEFAWVPAEGWDVGANAQWLEAELDEDFVVNPRPGNRRLVITDGQKLPNVPEFKGSLWASYTWPVQFIQGGEMFLRGQYSYTGDSINILVPFRFGDTGANPSHEQASYSIADLRLGLISNDGEWQLDVFVNNITDERAEIYQGTGDFEWAFSRTGEYDHFHRLYTNRPREYGIRFSKQWGD